MRLRMILNLTVSEVLELFRKRGIEIVTIDNLVKIQRWPLGAEKGY
jgi:hypothetical protein